MKLIAQGAEAKIYLDKYTVTKNRIPKSYRHPQLDQKIRTSRTKREAKLLTKAGQFINTPNILDTEKFLIKMQFINGDKLSETLDSYNKNKQAQVMEKLGKQAAKLHANNIIHGDLTTSNTILNSVGGWDTLFIIDFGLGFISTRLEDKAVDIHLIKQALEAKHFQNWEKLFENFLKGYKWEETNKVLKQLKKVESRGRYK